MLLIISYVDTNLINRILWAVSFYTLDSLISVYNIMSLDIHENY
jgi:hypothetical protein